MMKVSNTFRWWTWDSLCKARKAGGQGATLICKGGCGGGYIDCWKDGLWRVHQYVRKGDGFDSVKLGVFAHRRAAKDALVWAVSQERSDA